ncbi:MAG: EthD domain-containing protein [Dehalococcoidia bacterium]
MIKAMSLLTRKQGVTQEEFAEHYEDVHVPLALRHFPFKRYVRNYVIKPPDAEEPEFDCITEVWFETMEDCQAAAEFSVSEAYRVIAEDEEKFMDRSKIVAFLVEEKVTE